MDPFASPLLTKFTPLLATRALIGHTGFVGGNLSRQSSFDTNFNSRNFNEMRGQHFDEVYCAGVSAVKWKANQDPRADREALSALEDALREVRAKRFILISTIDVYAETVGGDENTNVHVPNHAYGANRLAFEDFCREQFEECFVVRLPGLFGPGLRKNVLYDLINDNCLANINPRSSIQYYNLAHLTDDIQLMIRHNIHLLNLFPEPIFTQIILDRFFPAKEVGLAAGPEVHYDIGTAHANIWGRTDKYCMGEDMVLDQMDKFFSETKKQGRDV